MQAVKQDDSVGAREILKPYEKGLALAKAASLQPRAHFKRDWDLGLVQGFEYAVAEKAIVRTLYARAEMEAKEGRIDPSVDDLATAKRLTKLVGNDPTVIMMLVEIALDAIIQRFVQEISGHWAQNSTALRALSSIANDEMRPDLVRICRAEAYTALASLRNYDPIYLTKTQFDSDGPPKRIDNKELLHTGYPSNPASRRLMTKMLSAWTQLAGHFDEIQKDPSRIDPIQSKIAKSLWGAGEEEEGARMACFDPMGTGIALGTREQALDRCTNALVQALEIHARTGSYPKTIQDIPGTWVDPFNKGPLKLKLTSQGIRIYSIGPDLKDDGGISQNETPMFAQKGWDVVASYPPISSRYR